MSTLSGTSAAVVVGTGPVTPSPPQAAVACWTNPTYFDTWERGVFGGLLQETGCSSSGYPWTDDNPFGPSLPYEQLTVNGSWYQQLLGSPVGTPPPVVSISDIGTQTGALPFDPVQCTITFPLTLNLAVTTDVDNTDTFTFTVSRSADALGLSEKSNFTILSQSRQTHTPLGNYTDLRISFTDQNGNTTNTGYVEFAGLLPAATTITIQMTSTSLTLTAGANTVSLPCVTFVAAQNLVFASIGFESQLSNSEGPFDPVGSPNSAFSCIVGPLQVNAPLGNCEGTSTIPQSLVLDDFNRTVGTSSFGTASSGNAWKTPGGTWGGSGTGTLSVNGSSGVIVIAPTSGGTIQEIGSSLPFPSIFIQPSGTREIKITWFFTVTSITVPTISSDVFGFGLHGINDGTPVGSWLGNGGEPYGALVSIQYFTSDSLYHIGGALGTASGGGSSNTWGVVPMVVNTAYALELNMSDAAGAMEVRYWATSGSRPTTPLASQPMDPALGPIDGAAVWAAAQVGKNTTFTDTEIDVSFTSTADYTFPQC